MNLFEDGSLAARVASRRIKVADIDPDSRGELDRQFLGRDMEALQAACLSYHSLPDEDVVLLLAFHTVRAADARARARALADTLTCSVLATPTVLFRSMSVSGLWDLVDTGRVHGSLNAWHSIDRRPVVLFGDRFGTVVGQGEDVVRAVEAALPDHPAITACRAADAEAALAGRDGAHADRLRKAAWAAYLAKRAALQHLIDREERTRRRSPWSSAVIRTRPMVGATVWPGGHRDNMMGEHIHEYGFPDGAVLARDVDAVLLVKDREVVLETDVQGARDHLLSWRDRMPEADDEIGGGRCAVG